jgi:hypothetical protein
MLIRIAIAVALFLSAASTARASSLFYDFSFSGTVESAVEVPTFSSFPAPKVITSMIGQPFTASFLITQTGSITTGVASLDTNFAGVTITPYSTLPGMVDQTSTGIRVYGDASLSSSSPSNFSGAIGALSFVYANGSGNVLVAPIHVSSINEADDQGAFYLTLNTTVSSVPLPPALPMFASALLALGIFGVYARRKQAPLSAPLSLS